MGNLISKLSKIRSEYNYFDVNEEPYYRALSEAIKILSQRADGDIISRQDALKSPVKMVSEGLDWIPVYHIKDLPPVQPKREKGYWMDDGDCYVCSQCRTAYSWWAHSLCSNYCPNCGADMRGEEHETD